jgi:hypothetical protein
MLYSTDHALVLDLKTYHPSTLPPTSIFYMFINEPHYGKRKVRTALGETSVLIRSGILYTPAPHHYTTNPEKSLTYKSQTQNAPNELHHAQC